MKHNPPKISIVTPCFNHGHYIEDSIKSVLDQAYPNFEHIIVDNCSSDRTEQILKRYDHLTVISEPDKGQSDALNKGFRQASGDIIGWLNADEFYMPGTFAQLTSHIQAGMETDIYYGDVVFTGPAADFRRLKAGHSFDQKILLYYGCFIPTVSTFFSSRLFSEGFFIDHSYDFCMDFEYFIRLSAAGKKFGYIPRPLGVFRWDGQNKSLDIAQASREAMDIRKKYSNIRAGGLIKQIRLAYHLVHAWKKLYERRYFFEYKSRRFAGLDFRWFQNNGQMKTCLELENIYDSPLKLIELVNENQNRHE